MCTLLLEIGFLKDKFQAVDDFSYNFNLQSLSAILAFFDLLQNILKFQEQNKAAVLL